MVLKIISYRPPKIAQLFVLIAALLHWLTPLGRVILYSNQFAGIILGIAGFSVMMWAWWLFKKFDNAICPTAKTGLIISTGIYRFSRNPMYLGMVCMMLGLAIFAGSISFYIAVVSYFIIINNVFCRYEEGKLSADFGESYDGYKANVRRWL